MKSKQKNYFWLCQGSIKGEHFAISKDDYFKIINDLNEEHTNYSTFITSQLKIDFELDKDTIENNYHLLVSKKTYYEYSEF